MTDFEDRLASIAEKRHGAQRPDAQSGTPDWTKEPEFFDRETRRDIKAGVIGALLGAASVLLGGIATVAAADMLDWDWAAIAIPPGTKIGAVGLGIVVFCIAGLMMERVGRVAMAAGFGIMLVAEPRLAHQFPDAWMRLYQVDIGLDRGARTAELYVPDPDAARPPGPLSSPGGLEMLLGDWSAPLPASHIEADAVPEIALEAEAAPAPTGKSW